MKEWDPDCDPLIVGHTVYDAFSLGWRAHNSIKKNGRLELKVLKHAKRLKENLINFCIFLKEARGELMPLDMDEVSRITLVHLIQRGQVLIKYIRFLLGAFEKLCAEDGRYPGQEDFEDFFMEGFLGVRDPIQWGTILELSTNLEFWAKEYETLEASLSGRRST